MSAIDKIKLKLKKYPHIKYELWDGGITVFPESEDGFPVNFYQKENACIVEFISTAVWQREFDDEEEALNCFAFALSNECRIKEIRRGKFAYKWIIQFKDAENWIDDSVTSYFFCPFWKKKNIKYLQNDLVR
jgi:hypothetical protein